MEQKTASRHHFNGKRPQTLGSCLTIFSRSLLLLLSVSIWVTGCGKDGDVVKNFFGGGGATGDGGGGQGIQCDKTATNAEIRNRLFVRDIYEAIVDKDLKMKSVPGGPGTEEVSDQALEILAGSLKSYFGPASYSLEFTKASFWKRIEKAIVFLEDGHELLASQDANSPIHLQKGCSAVQIAFWDESSGIPNEHKLYVNRKFWKSLDQLNKIALLAHEVFYAQARKSGYKNSDTVRNKIGQLLSKESLVPLFTAFVPSKVPSIKDVLPASSIGFKTCEGTSQADPDAKLHMYQYQGNDGKQYFTFPVISSNSINSAYLQGASFTFDPHKNQSLAAATDLLYFQSELHDEATEPRLDIFHSRWYSNPSLLTPVQDMSLQHFFNWLPSKVGRDTALWTGHLKSAPTPITLTLLNSTHDWNQPRKPTLLTVEERMSEINLNIKSTFSTCDIKDAEAEAAIALLYNEIKSAIERGAYPNGFPKWTQTLKQLTEKALKAEANEDFCSLNTNERLSVQYPAYLYSLHLKTETVAQGEEAMGAGLYKPGSYQQLPLGKMRLSQGTNTLEFDLRCNDYATAYAETVLKEKNQSSSIQGHNVTSLLSEAEPELSVESINNMHRFMNFIRSSDERTRNVLYPEFIKSNYPSDEFPRERPEQYRAFFADLSREKDLTFGRCERDINDYILGQAKHWDTNCLIATFKRSKHTYMVYFTYGSTPQESDQEKKQDEDEERDPDLQQRIDEYYELHKDIPSLQFIQLIPSVD